MGFAAGEGGGGLAEADVAKADFLESLELVINRGEIFEKLSGFVDGHL